MRSTEGGLGLFIFTRFHSRGGNEGRGGGIRGCSTFTSAERTKPRSRSMPSSPTPCDSSREWSG
jgi:hypothetical protein